MRALLPILLFAMAARALAADDDAAALSLADQTAKTTQAASDWRAFGTMAVRVPPHRPGETARIAKVNVKAGRVCIARPLHGDRADPPSVMLTLVEVNEIDPPKGHTPIVWRLLTTLPVCGAPDEFAAANEIVQLYRLRWRIEQVFRATKSDGLQAAAATSNKTTPNLASPIRTD